MKNDGPTQNDRIQYLLLRKFPLIVLRDQQKKMGHLNPETDTLFEAVKTYRAELEAMTPDERDALYGEEKQKEQQEAAFAAKLEDQKRFFNQPEAQADFGYWSKATYWTLDEAIALSFGKDPEPVNWDSLQGLTKISPFAKQYERRLNLARRAQSWNQLFDPVSPGIFLAWAKRTGIDVPIELVGHVTEHGVAIADWQDCYAKLQKQYNDLLAEHQNLIGQMEEESARDESSRGLDSSDYWQRLKNLGLRAVNKYPAWKELRSKVQKTGNLQDWLLKDIGADSREAEILKKILSDFFSELK